MRVDRAGARSLVAALALALAACGGSGSSTRSNTRALSSSSGVSATAPSQLNTGPLRASLHAPDHAPKVGRLWPYSVHASDAGGHPLAGSVDIEFVLDGQVVGRDTPPTHPLENGLWHDRLTFPSQAVGHPLTFRVVVHTARGNATLDWPVNVEP